MTKTSNVAMPVDTVLGWIDEEIADLTKTIEDQPESIKAIVGFTIDHLKYMKATLLKNIEDMQKAQKKAEAVWDSLGEKA